MADDSVPRYTIERVGRWVYHVNLSMPFALPDLDIAFTTQYQQPWLAFGRRHAEWLGARKLRAYLRREAWKEIDNG